MRWAGILGLVVVAALGIGAVADIGLKPSNDNVGWALRDGAVVGRDAVFVMHPGSGIDAIDVATGVKRWHSDAAAKPIGLNANNLLTQRNAEQKGMLSVAVLSADSGAEKSASDLSIPETISARVTEGLRTRFAIDIVDSGADMKLAWSARQKPARGMPGGDRATELKGAAQVDLSSGVIQKLAVEDLPPRRAKSASETALIDGVEGRQFLSADNAHVLVSTKVAEGGDWLRYRWTVYEVNGTELGSVASFTSFAPFVVRDGVLVTTMPPHQRQAAGDQLVTEGLSVIGVDLASGEQRWRHDLADTRYRGAAPS